MTRVEILAMVGVDKIAGGGAGTRANARALSQDQMAHGSEQRADLCVEPFHIASIEPGNKPDKPFMSTQSPYD